MVPQFTQEASLFDWWSGSLSFRNIYLVSLALNAMERMESDERRVFVWSIRDGAGFHDKIVP